MTAVQVPDRLEDEIARMMREHGAFLLRLCFLSLQDRGLAEDAVQGHLCQSLQRVASVQQGQQRKDLVVSHRNQYLQDYHRRNWFIMMKAHVPFIQAW